MQQLIPLHITEYFFKLLVATAFYTFSSRTLLNYFAPDDSVSIFFIASGVALATVLIGGSRYALSIFLGSTLSNSLGGLPVVTAMVMGIGSTLGALLAADWLTRYRHLDLSLTSLSDWLKLMLWGGCFGCSINAVIGSTALLMTGVISTDSYFSKITHWWMGDALGVFIVTPFILTTWQARKLAINPKQLVEALLMIGLSFLVGQVVFLDWFHNYLGQIANSYWMFVLITWIALRLNTQWMTLFMVMTAIQALQGVYSELGIINSDITENEALSYWLYLVALSCVGITLSTFITTHRYTHTQKQEALERLEKIASRLPGMVYSFRLMPNGDSYLPYSSAAIHAIYRVSPEEVQHSAAKIFTVLHPDDYEQIIDSIKVSAQNLTAWQQEYRVRFDDGTVRWLYGNALPQREENGATLWHGFITDITEIKQIHVAEQQQHALLLNVINSLSHPFYVVNTDDYTIQLANQSAGVWLRGITTCYQLSHKQNFPCLCIAGRHPCPIEEVKRTKKPLTVEHLHYNENGEPRIVEVFAYPIFDAAGEVHQLIEYAIDITERKQMEEGLKASEARFRSIIDVSPVPMALYDERDNIMFLNAAFVQTFGYDTSDVPTMADWWRLASPDPDYRLWVMDIWQSALKIIEPEQPLSVAREINIHCKNGTQKTILASTAILLESTYTLHLVVLYDITERKQMEIALRNSEQRLNEAERIAQIGNWELDFLTNTLTWSDGIFQIFDIDKKQFSATYEAFLAAIHPDDREEVDAAYTESLQTHKPYNISHRLIMPDGQIKYVHEQCETYFNSEGTPIRSIGTVQDITERKTIEAELRRSNTDLEQFAYAVSHDMRQPLRMVSSYLSLLESALVTQLDEETHQFLTFALDGAKRMDAMILSLLDYSRIGRSTLPLTIISSRTAVNEALAFLEPELRTSGGHVEVTGEWGELCASRDELTRLLQNLIGNALKYHEKNKPPYVEVRATIIANTFKVIVRDSGIGIDPKQIDRLFKVFSRLHARTRFEGTGVGLALCRKIVEHHGGQIGVKSAGEGHGSLFWFELPLSQASRLELN